MRTLAVAAISILCGVSSLLGQAAVCGNGVREGPEQCDDGGNVNLDGCSAQCKFEQIQRINQLKMQFSTDVQCTLNAFGGAFVQSTVQSQVQASLDASVQAGTTSIMFTMLGLDDLTGTNDGSLQVGVVNGNPLTGATTYDGTNDVDWWYAPDAADIDATRTPLALLPASIVATTLSAEGLATLKMDVAGSVSRLTMSSMRIRGTTGAATKPTLSINSSTPGHLQSEHLDPALNSYQTSGATITGELCGNIRASSLAATPAPTTLVAGGSNACTESYPANSSLLDIIVGGCHKLLIVGIAPTQPDQNDASPGGGPPYKLIETNHVVTSCKDKNNATVTLSTCLDVLTYSSFYKFSTDRVIITGGARGCPSAPQASNQGPICAGQTLQLTAAGPTGTYQWSGPNGFTSSLQNPTISNATTAASGTYSVTIQLDGCISPASTTTVTVNSTPAMPAISAPPSVATRSTGSTASIIAHAGDSYAWTISNGTITAGSTTNQITFTAGASGSVSLSVVETSASGCASAQATVSIPITGVPAPQNLSATAVSTGEVVVSWLPSDNASTYEVFRRGPDSPSALVMTIAAPPFHDLGVSANTSYLYAVRAVDGSNNRSAFSNGDVATTVVFSEDPLTSQVTTVKAVHIAELRTAVVAVRNLAGGLPAVTFTDAALDPSVLIKAVHITELRGALNEARAALSLPAQAYTDSTLAAGSINIKAAHVQELRSGVK